ncbi:MAG TPA: protein phosphatase 2C domain-containing protein [Stellaceae bacterium]|nr:protein phosphatase 2C domain-containing protein [Stellaceae bacterium]
MAFRVWAETDVGTVRKHNEDALVSRPDLGLWAVADGAGGHSAGEVASGRIAESLGALPPGLPPQDALRELRTRISDVHVWLRQEAASRGPGTIIASTVVILLIRDQHFVCFWAGDSRAYLQRDGETRQITRDHSLVQEMVENGLIAADQAESHPQANVITRAVGADNEGLELDKVSGRLLPGDRFLLCSDGLCKTVAASRLGELLAGNGADNIARTLIDAALTSGTRDNVTAVVVDVGDGTP